MTEEDQRREQPTINDDSDSLPNDHSLLPSLQETVPVPQLNLTHGMAGSVMEDILQYADQNAICQRIIENQRIGEHATIALSEKKKVSAGILFKAGKSVLDCDVRVLVAKNVEDKEKMEESVHQRKAGESRKKHAVAVEVRSLQKQPTKWMVAQLKAMVSYKKLCTDKKLPTKRADLMQRYLLTKDRVSPPGTPIADGDE